MTDKVREAELRAMEQRIENAILALDPPFPGGSRENYGAEVEAIMDSIAEFAVKYAAAPAPAGAPDAVPAFDAHGESIIYRGPAIDPTHEALNQLRDLHAALLHEDRIVPLDVRFHRLDEAIRATGTPTPATREAKD